jgi:hypothetical protein
MSVRVGHIMRHEDVHGVSGVGKVAEVFEASNGKAIVVWISSTPSVVVFDSIKALEVPHRHGGKTEIIWDWESPADPDPMEEILNGEKPKLSEEEIEALAEEAAEAASGPLAEKLKEKVKEKVRKAEEHPTTSLEDLEEEPVEDKPGEKKKDPPKKRTAKPKASKGKDKK